MSFKTTAQGSQFPIPQNFPLDTTSKKSEKGSFIYRLGSGLWNHKGKVVAALTVVGAAAVYVQKGNTLAEKTSNLKNRVTNLQLGSRALDAYAGFGGAVCSPVEKARGLQKQISQIELRKKANQAWEKAQGLPERFSKIEFRNGAQKLWDRAVVNGKGVSELAAKQIASELGNGVSEVAARQIASELGNGVSEVAARQIASELGNGVSEVAARQIVSELGNGVSEVAARQIVSETQKSSNEPKRSISQNPYAPPEDFERTSGWFSWRSKADKPSVVKQAPALTKKTKAITEKFVVVQNPYGGDPEQEISKPVKTASRISRFLSPIWSKSEPKKPFKISLEEPLPHSGNPYVIPADEEVIKTNVTPWDLVNEDRTQAKINNNQKKLPIEILMSHDSDWGSDGSV